MNDDNDFTWMGVIFLVAKFFGVIALVLIPIYLVYKLIKWLFD